MSNQKPFTLRWGILATGGIAKAFTKDILLPPSSRGVDDIKHVIAAVGSSSSVSRAEDFLREVGLRPKSSDAPTARAYGSYKELVADEDVDIIYVATPHSHHYQNAMLALKNGKHVLCEKALTVNAAQARALVEEAKSRNLFLMEALWTRYLPLSAYVRETIASGRIGTLQRISADNSIAIDPDNQDYDKNRLVALGLAGGALLDSGIYALTWVFQSIFPTLPADKRKKPEVVSWLKKFPPTGVDEMTSILLRFERGGVGEVGDVHAIATTSLRLPSAADKVTDEKAITPCVLIQGIKGEIHVFPPASRPTRTKLVLYDGTVEEKQWPQPGSGKPSGWFRGFNLRNAEVEGLGMFWEADECAFAIRDGRKEGRLEGWDESITIMDVMDEVRKAGGLKYPEKIETTDWPVDLDDGRH